MGLYSRQYIPLTLAAMAEQQKAWLIKRAEKQGPRLRKAKTLLGRLHKGKDLIERRLANDGRLTLVGKGLRNG